MATTSLFVMAEETISVNSSSLSATQSSNLPPCIPQNKRKAQQCTMCDKWVKNRPKHERFVHYRELNLAACETCHHTIARRHLNEHIKNLHGTQSTKIKCSFKGCPEEVSKYALKNHIKNTHHWFACLKCNSEYRGYATIRRHIHKHHARKGDLKKYYQQIEKKDNNV